MRNKIVTREFKILFAVEGQEDLEDLGLEAERETDSVTICMNDVTSFHPAKDRNNTIVLMYPRNFEADIKYEDFKKLHKTCINEINEYNPRG